MSTHTHTLSKNIPGHVHSNDIYFCILDRSTHKKEAEQPLGVRMNKGAWGNNKNRCAQGCRFCHLFRLYIFWRDVSHLLSLHQHHELRSVSTNYTCPFFFLRKRRKRTLLNNSLSCLFIN